MAKKKKDKEKKGDDATLPKFSGFHALAGGLSDIKAKMDAEKKAAEQQAAEKKKAAGPAPSRPKPPPPVEPRGGSSLTRGDADEELTFHRMMQGVTPLESGRARVPVTSAVPKDAPRLRAAEMQARAREEAEKALDHLHALVDDAARFEVSDDGKRVEGRRVDASPDLVRSLRRGMLPIDGRLDLHGLTAGEAREKLVEFLRTMRARGERCVLVIHGKGERTPGAGVLRGEIAAWLSQGKARESVAAFATAREDDGGEGAVYVALRR